MLPGSIGQRARKLQQEMVPPPHRGVFVGEWIDPRRDADYLRDNGPGHGLTFAPTRAGKGVSCVIPTLNTWEESALVHDMKGENWAKSAGWRKWLGQKVFRFDPGSNAPDVASYNPLEEIRLGTDYEVADSQNIAQILVDPEGKGLQEGQDAHWRITAFQLLTAIILHVCYVARLENKRDPDRYPHGRLSDVDLWFTSSDENDDKEIKTIYERLQDMGNTNHIPGRRLKKDGAEPRGRPHPYISAAAVSFQTKNEKELVSIVSSAATAVEIYREPLVARNTARSDFRIADFQHGDRPSSVYLVVRPSDAERLQPLVRMMITQFLTKLVEKMEFDQQGSITSYKHRLLVMLDEFASLKRLRILEQTMPFLAGFGIKVWLVAQDQEQITQLYGRHETITSQCSVKQVFAPNKIETAQLISRMAGTTTIRKKSVSKGAKGKGGSSAVSESFSEERRDLIQPAEVMQLPRPKMNANQEIVEAGEQLVFVSGHPPIRCLQALYFNDPVLLERSLIPPPERSDSTFNDVDEERLEPDEPGKPGTGTAEHDERHMGDSQAEKTPRRFVVQHIELADDLLLSIATDLELPSRGSARKSLEIADMERVA